MSKEEMQRLAEEMELEEVLFADGYENAFVGFGTKFTAWSAVYDYDKCIEVLKRDGMSHEEAVEFFEFNTAGAFMGENTPVFLRFPEPLEPLEPLEPSAKLPEPTSEQEKCQHVKWHKMDPKPRHCVECGLLMWDAGD